MFHVKREHSLRPTHLDRLSLWYHPEMEPDHLPIPAPKLEPELTPPPAPPPPAEYLVPYANPNEVIPPEPPAEQKLQAAITDAVADTLHAIDIRNHLALLARTDPTNFRLWVQMALPRTGARGPQQATIVNVTNALPKSALDGLPPGFDIHR